MIDLAKLNGMTEGVAEGIDDLLGAALDVSGGGSEARRVNRMLISPFFYPFPPQKDPPGQLVLWCHRSQGQERRCRLERAGES